MPRKVPDLETYKKRLEDLAKVVGWQDKDLHSRIEESRLIFEHNVKKIQLNSSLDSGVLLLGSVEMRSDLSSLVRQLEGSLLRPRAKKKYGGGSRGKSERILHLVSLGYDPARIAKEMNYADEIDAIRAIRMARLWANKKAALNQSKASRRGVKRVQITPQRNKKKDKKLLVDYLSSKVPHRTLYEEGSTLLIEWDKSWVTITNGSDVEVYVLGDQGVFRFVGGLEGAVRLLELLL